MNTQEEAVYRRLAEHLDTLPDGYPPSRTGADLRILARLFTMEEAALAVHMTLKRETANVIARRAGRSAEEVEGRLANMATKGLVFSVEREGAVTLYQAVPFIVGIFEFQVNALTPGLLADLQEYAATCGAWPRVKTIPQLRTIPVEVTLESHVEALPYERARALVDKHDRFAVAECICRTIAGKSGGGCDAPLETCMFFGDWADFYVKTGRGRRISRTDVMNILDEANSANLVLQPSNTKEAAVICCCCGCCCGALAPLKALEHPAAEVASSYVASFDEAVCSHCHKCLDRCQMGAIRRANGAVALNVDRCIGCGLCVATCPSGALRLIRRKGTRGISPPDNIDEMWDIMRKARANASQDSGDSRLGAD